MIICDAIAPKAKNGRGNGRGHGCGRGRGQGNTGANGNNDKKGKLNHLQKTLDGLVIRKPKSRVDDDDSVSVSQEKVIKAAIETKAKPSKATRASNANVKGQGSSTSTPWNYYEPPPGVESSSSTLHLQPNGIGFVIA